MKTDNNQPSTSQGKKEKINIALFDLVKVNNLELLELELKSEVNPNEVDDKRRTALHWCGKTNKYSSSRYFNKV